MEAVTGGITAEPTSGWRRVDPAYLVLALLPWLLAATDSAWLYNPLSNIDPWVYFGYFLDYPRYVSDLFPGLYYGTRLPWILPGHLLYLLFGAAGSRYVLHFGFYYLALFSLYGLLRRAAGPRSALLGAVLFGAHSYFLRAIGWDYVDGPSMTYNLLGLLCAARAAESRRAWLWLMLCGMAGAAMFYCNIFTVIFLPFLPVFYLYQTHRGFTWVTVHGAFRFLLWFGVGALLISGLLEMVNYSVTGSMWFYSPSFQFVRNQSSKPNQWRFEGWHWVTVASWLGIPASAALGSITYVLLRARYRALANRDLRLFFVLQYLGYVGIMIAWHVVGGIGLQWPWYTSYLLPPAFLAIGCILARSVETLTPLRYGLLLTTAAVSFAASLPLFASPFAAHLFQIGWWNVSACVGLCLAISYLWSRWQILPVTLCGLWLYQTGFPPTDWHAEPKHRASFLRVVDSLKVIREHTGDVPWKFWYNIREPSGFEFNAINSSYLRSWAIISPDFPALSPEYPVEIGTAGVILSSQKDALQQANRALNSKGLEARSLGGGTIDRDAVSYQIFFFSVQAAGTGPEVPLKLSPALGQSKQLLPDPLGNAAPLPMERWAFCEYPHGNGHMDIRPEGVFVTTHYPQYSYAVKYGPLTPVKTGTYRFVLQYQHLNGGLGFGVVSPDGSHWLAPPVSVQKTGGSGTRVAYVSLQAGTEMFLMVYNCLPSGPERNSTFLIRSVQAFGAFSE